MADAMPPAWMDRCYLTITQWGASSGTSISMQGIIDRSSLSIDVGEKPVDAIALLNQGYVYSYKAEEMTEVSFDYYTKLAAVPAIYGGVTNLNQTALDQFFMGTSIDASEPTSLTNTTTRNKVRIAILWTTDTSLSAATAQTSANKPARRILIADAFVTAHTLKFDEILKVSVTIKAAPFDADAVSNIKVETTDGTSQLAAVSDYAGTTKF